MGNIPDIFEAWLSEKLAQFSLQHPKLNLLISSSILIADITRRETDITLRFLQSPPEDIVGRKVCVLPVALYANIDF
jgi:DNA-binding transcriptional LysR family regulator